MIFDELWQFTSLEAKRAIDELTTVPGKHCLNLVVSYAGFSSDEDTHLWRWYKWGMDVATGKAGPDLEFFFLWRTDYSGIPWVSEKYLAGQRAKLSDAAYRRFHENQWVEAEQAFIDAATLGRCTHDDLQRGRPCLQGGLYVGVDIGLKHDNSAVAAVGLAETPGNLALYDHALFVPERGQEIHLESTVEAYLLELSRRYLLEGVLYDPYQFARSAQTLQAKGLPMIEYPQTVANTVQMAQTTQGLFKSAKLELYESQELRRHLLNSAVKETQRGYRIVKGGSQSKKIDLGIALAMAVQGAAGLLGDTECEIVELGQYDIGGGFELPDYMGIL